MFLELIATAFAGLAAAGVLLALNRLTGGRLPRWSMPVAAGLTMIGVTVASEYGWYGRNSADLPEGLVIAQTVDKRSFYQPWTYAVPYVHRFVAVDTATIRSRGDQHIADLYFFGRWAPLNRMPILVDCAGQRRASLADGVDFDAGGSVADPRWVAAGPEDAVVRTVCEAA
jgi:hypothetical protein